MSSRLAVRIPCPVCLGTKLEHVPVATKREALLLDHCQRCGGVWFDGGEVAALRALGPQALLLRLRPKADVYRTRCRSCDGFVGRDDPRCAACGYETTLDCPRCDDPMQIDHATGLRLDLCRGCKGVWLDNHELKEVWKLGLERARRRIVVRGQGRSSAVTDAGGAAAEALLYAPDLAFYGLHAAGRAAAGTADALGSGMDPAFEALGAAAQAVFEVILEAIAGLAG